MTQNIKKIASKIFSKISFKGSKMKRSVILILIVLGVMGSIFGVKFFQIHKMKQRFANRKHPATTVEAAQATKGTWQNHITAVGTLMAEQGVEITPEASGNVKNILFKSGTIVYKDQPIVILNHAVLQAQLRNATAKLQLAHITFYRNKKLYRTSAISKETLDIAHSNMEQAQALVDQYKASLSQKIVKAPFTGKIGIRKVNLGEFLSPGKQIATLESIDPIRVDFEIPGKYITKVKVGQSITLRSESYPDRKFAGKVIAIDSKIAYDTRSIKIRAELPNNDTGHMLTPGMFVNVNLLQPEQLNVVSIPQTSVTYTLYGNSVYQLSKKDNNLVAKRVYIGLGRRDNGRVIVLKGLKVGDLVVTYGTSKIHSGSIVKVVKSQSKKRQK